MTDKNNARYLFADYDDHRKAPLSRVIWKDHHTSWERSPYDFGNYKKVKTGIITIKASYYERINEV